MTQFQTREQRGIYVHVLPTQKYRFNTIVATLIHELQEETATGLAMLPYVLMRGSKQYPTPERLQLALDDLYGASLSGTVDKKGERQVVDFTMDVPNEKFLSTGEPLLQKAFGILSDIMLNPLVENDGFQQQNVEAEKEQHKKRIRAVVDDKMQYARERCVSELAAGEPYSIPRLGFQEQVDTVSGQDLYKMYQDLLRTAPMHIYVVGDVDVDEVANLIFDTFDSKREPRSDFPEVRIEHEVQARKEVVDRLEVNQGKLNLGLWANVDYASDDYLPMVVFNGIYGAFPHSKLFLNVREKHSLAYYATSVYDSLKGSIVVLAGVEFANFDKALSIMEEQLELIKQGEISDEELSFTVKGLINGTRTGMDSPTGLINMHVNGVVAGRIRPQEETIAAIQKVTKEDVKRVAQGVQIATVYKLQNKEGK
ncbi:MAG TPA: pitrilysin family protein [Bacilli bacterium]|nr:pitrilysin family protein [Bacilli bacterium]